MDIYIQNLILSKSINDHYAKRYIKFISNFLEQEKSVGETEHHHILPKCKSLFPEYKSFRKNPWNGVHLTQRQHLIAHWLLCKIYGDSQVRALWLMCQGRKIIPSKLYEKLRKEQAKQLSIIHKGNQHGKGYKMTPEQIKNSSEGHKKEVEFISPEGIKYIHKGLRDACMIHNLNYNCIIGVATGKRYQYKGWKCRYTNNPYPEYTRVTEQERSIRAAEGHKKLIHFTTPDGIEGTHRGINDFCKTYNLNVDYVRQVARGEKDYYKGWKISYSTL